MLSFEPVERNNYLCNIQHHQSLFIKNERVKWTFEQVSTIITPIYFLFIHIISIKYYIEREIIINYTVNFNINWIYFFRKKKKNCNLINRGKNNTSLKYRVHHKNLPHFKDYVSSRSRMLSYWFATVHANRLVKFLWFVRTGY